MVQPVNKGEATGHLERTVDHNLRGLFERALEAEPPAPPADLAREAMMRGTRLRRRRRWLTSSATAAVVAVLVATVGLNVRGQDRAPVTLAASAPVLLPPTDAQCRLPVPRTAAEVGVFLTPDITDRQRTDLYRVLRSHSLVRTVGFESREEAYSRFKETWRDNPDLVGAVSAAQLPESFRVELMAPSQFPDFAAEIRGIAGVQQVIRVVCPGRSPSKDGR